jgi:hypothetical protein
MRYEITPARMLNDQRGVFGLGFTDLAAAIVLFIILSQTLENTAYDIAALPVALVSLIVLSPIRLTQRRKIIRDTIRHYLGPKQLYARTRGQNNVRSRT